MTPVGTALHFRRENENLSSSADVLHKTKTWLFHVVVWLTTAKKWTKVKNARAGRAKHCFYPLNIQIRDVLAAVAVVVA